MLEIGLAIGDVGDAEEGGLRRDAAETVADGEASIALIGRDHRGDDAWQRRASTNQDCTHQCLAEARARGKLIGDAREPGAGHRDHGGRETEQSQHEGQVELRQDDSPS